MKVLHVITSLKQGGAQTALRHLVARMPQHDSEVIALLPDRTTAPALESVGARVTCVDLRRPSAVPALVSAMRRARPQLVQTWMHHADLIAGSIARATRLAPVVWNVRTSTPAAAGWPLASRLILRGCAMTSSVVPRRIVCVSESARLAHVAAGYDEGRTIVIPNGFDVDVFRPDPAIRTQVRSALDITHEDVVIGLFARLHPLKDHPTFIDAASTIARRHPSVRFLLAGDGVVRENEALVHQLESAGIADQCKLLGVREDVARLLTAVDIACLSSYSEGFPNAIGEAMSAGVPVVATIAGDSATLLGGCGETVPIRDPEAFAAACSRLIDAGESARVRIGAAGRERIRQNFSIDAIVARYDALYSEVIAAS